MMIICTEKSFTVIKDTHSYTFYIFTAFSHNKYICIMLIYTCFWGGHKFYLKHQILVVNWNIKQKFINYSLKNDLIGFCYFVNLIRHYDFIMKQKKYNFNLWFFFVPLHNLQTSCIVTVFINSWHESKNLKN